MLNYNFKKHQHLHVYLRLILFVRQYWFAFAMGLFGNILLAASNSWFMWLLKPILDKGFIKKDMHFIHWLPAIIFGAFLLRGVASYIADYYMAWAARTVIMRFRQEIFKHLLKIPATFYDRTNSGQILSTLIYNVDQLARASTDALVTVVQESFSVLGYLFVMFLISWKLSLIYIVAVPLIAITARYAGKRMRALSKNLQASMGTTMQIAQESIEGYQVVRIFGGEKYEEAKFNAITQHNRSREIKVTSTNSISGSLVQQFAGLAIVFIIWSATMPMAHVTAGGFAAMLGAMLALLKPMKNLTNVSSSIQKGIAAAESIFALLDQPQEKDSGHRKPHTVQGHLQFKDLSFYYPQSERKILNHINLEISAGKTTAFVGKSGAGKSTLVKLIPRFYDNYEGMILLDGHDLRDIELHALRDQIAIVSQNVMLFNDTIAGNIAYGQMNNASPEAIKEAAELAHADEFIQQLPEKYNTLIGDNGVLLSGGQRQRIAIARAILKNAPILILDEATSSLDSESEWHIQQALTELIKNRTTIVIAHRLSTVEKADQIVVLHQGEIIEQGSHQELLANNNHYAKLYRAQFKND